MEPSANARPQKPGVRYQEGTYCQKCGRKVDGRVRAVYVPGYKTLKLCANCQPETTEVKLDSK